MDFDKKRIGVLMGGSSGEREVSLRSGTGVYESLKRQGYDAVAIDVGVDIVERLKAERVEAAFIVLHGKGGEDGTIQGLLEILGIPYTGSGVMASAVSMDKIVTKMIFEHEGVPTPPAITFNADRPLAEQSQLVIERLGLPVILKPADEGSSLGVKLVKERGEILPSVEALTAEYPRSLAEKYITGMCATVGVLGVGEKTRAMPVLELVPKNEFYDYEAKYTKGMTEFYCPARINEEATRRAQETALKAHYVLGCHGWSRVDMVITPDGKPFVLEVNSIPGMTTLSDLPAEAAAEGHSYDELVVEILHSAAN
ncbi:MAG: D-alanine--D-alanine ligase [bacterium]